MANWGLGWPTVNLDWPTRIIVQHHRWTTRDLVGQQGTSNGQLVTWMANWEYWMANLENWMANWANLVGQMGVGDDQLEKLVGELWTLVSQLETWLANWETWLANWGHCLAIWEPRLAK